MFLKKRDGFRRQEVVGSYPNSTNIANIVTSGQLLYLSESQFSTTKLKNESNNTCLIGFLGLLSEIILREYLYKAEFNKL